MVYSPAPSTDSQRHLIAHCGVDADIHTVEDALASASSWTSVTVVGSTAELREALERLVATSEHSSDSRTVVIPITSGRNVTLIADTAKVCSWARTCHPQLRGHLALADAPLTATSTVAWLRASLRHHTSHNDLAVICSRSIDPFADAELFRLARLAWTNGSGADVIVAFDDAYPSVEQASAPHRERARKIATIRADIHPGRQGAHKPLLSGTALAVAVTQAASSALHRLGDHDDDGIDAAVLADHDHGYAHGHGDDDDHPHGHSHSHGHHHHSHGHHHHGHHHEHEPTITLELGDDHAL